MEYFAGKKRKKSRRAYTGRRKGFPRLDDLVKTIPKGGLLNPGLRRGFGHPPSAKQVLGR